MVDDSARPTAIWVLDGRTGGPALECMMRSRHQMRQCTHRIIEIERMIWRNRKVGKKAHRLAHRNRHGARKRLTLGIAKDEIRIDGEFSIVKQSVVASA